MSIKVHKGSAPYLFMAQGTNFGTFLTLCQKFAKIKSKVEPADISSNTRTRSVHSVIFTLWWHCHWQWQCSEALSTAGSERSLNGAGSWPAARAHARSSGSDEVESVNSAEPRGVWREQ